MSNIQEKHLRGLEKQIREREERVRGTERVLAAKERMRIDVERETARAKNVLAIVTKQVEKYEERRTKLEGQLHDLTETIRKHEKRMEELANQRSLLEKDVDEMTLALAKTRKETKVSVDTMRRAQEKLQDAEKERDSVIESIKRINRQ